MKYGQSSRVGRYCSGLSLNYIAPIRPREQLLKISLVRKEGIEIPSFSNIRIINEGTFYRVSRRCRKKSKQVAIHS